MKHYTLFACCLLISSLLFSQSPANYGNITSEEMAISVCAFDSSADAVILSQSTIIDVSQSDLKYVMRAHIRIKILKASSSEWNDVTIYYQSGGGMESIIDIGAQTIAPDGSKHQVTSDQIIDDVAGADVRFKKFTFRNVQVGCVLEYYYTKVVQDIFFLPICQFQYAVPLLKADLTLRINATGAFDNNQRVASTGGLAYNYLLNGMTQFTSGENNIYTNGNMSLVVDNKHFVATNIPAMKDAPFITGIDNFRIGVRFQLTEYQLGGESIKFDNWEELGAYLLNDEEFGHQFRDSYNARNIYKTAKPYIDIATTDSMKVEAAYKWLAENMVWNGSYRAYSEEKLEKLYEKKTASSGELNMMLLAILQPYNIEGLWAALTSTRSNGDVYTEFPFRYQFNHMMVYYDGCATPRWYDVQGIIQESGRPSLAALGNKAWIVSKKAPTRFVDIKANRGTDAITFNLHIYPDGSINGDAAASYVGYNAQPERRHHLKDSTGLQWVERLKERYPEVKIDTVTRQNLRNTNMAFKETFQFKLPNSVVENGDMRYFSPIIYAGFLENPFKEPTRQLPIMFPYPIRETIVTTVFLPEGYVLAELPKSIAISLVKAPDFTYSYTARMSNDSTLVLTSKLEVNRLQYEPNEYQAVKEMYDNISEKLNEQLVLKKK